MFLLSILVGLLAGLAAVTLKNITYAIEVALEDGIIFSENQLYFILPVVGLFLVYLFTKYIYKKPIEHAIPSILYSLSKKKEALSQEQKYTCH